jgi:site-specific DNA-methyltransferase (adenine-specific)
MLEINKTYLGDCLEIMKDIDDKSIDLVISDPPYGISYDNWDVLHNNTNSALLKDTNNKSFKKRNKPINGWSKEDRNIGKEYEDFLLPIFNELFRITKESSPIIMFSSRRMQHNICNSLEKAGFLIKDVLIWKKSKAHFKAQKVLPLLENRVNKFKTILKSNIEEYKNYRIGNLLPTYEPIIYAFKPYSKTILDTIINDDLGGININEKNNSIIFEYKNDKNTQHPTQKPIELIQDLIKTFSINKNHLILDPFAGSGTTGIASINTNRNYIMIEKDTEYYNIINKRIEQTSNK